MRVEVGGGRGRGNDVTVVEVDFVGNVGVAET